MCQRKTPKSTPEQLQKFYGDLLSLLAQAPEDAVLIVMSMFDHHAHPRGPLLINVRGSGCSLVNLMRGAISDAPQFKELFERTQRSIKESPFDVSRAAEDIANGD